MSLELLLALLSTPLTHLWVDLIKCMDCFSVTSCYFDFKWGATLKHCQLSTTCDACRYSLWTGSKQRQKFSEHGLEVCLVILETFIDSQQIAVCSKRHRLLILGYKPPLTGLKWNHFEDESVFLPPVLFGFSSANRCLGWHCAVTAAQHTMWNLCSLFLMCSVWGNPGK